MTLDDLRKQIDAIDAELVGLLNRRATVAEQIGSEKRKHGGQVRNKQREDQVVKHAQELNAGPMSPASIERIYRQIIDACSEVQAG